MITTTLKSNLSATVRTETHSLVSDVTKEKGGDDEGFDPHELVEAGLGACTNITLKMYAKRKGIDLQDVITTVKIVKEGDENQILREIQLVGNLDREQQERLMIIANKCPIHNFLQKKSVIETRQV